MRANNLQTSFLGHFSGLGGPILIILVQLDAGLRAQHFDIEHYKEYINLKCRISKVIYSHRGDKKGK